MSGAAPLRDSQAILRARGSSDRSAMVERSDAHVGTIVEALRPIVEPVLDAPGDQVENAVRADIRAQVTELTQRSPLLAGHVEAGELRIVGARYDLDDGRVTFVAP